LNALSSETYAWSSARPLSMLTSLAAIKWGNLSWSSGRHRSKRW
jgi:hypothetical protein